MQKQEIKLSVISIDDGDHTIQYKVEITNGVSFASLDFYGYTDIFKEFAKGLLLFPNTPDDRVKYELGEVNGNWAYYFFLEAFCYERNGYSAMRVIVDNNGKPPYTNRNEFYITCVPASLNKFGQLLNGWDPMTENEIRWIVE